MWSPQLSPANSQHDKAGRYLSNQLGVGVAWLGWLPQGLAVAAMPHTKLYLTPGIMKEPV